MDIQLAFRHLKEIISELRPPILQRVNYSRCFFRRPYCSSYSADVRQCNYFINHWTSYSQYFNGNFRKTCHFGNYISYVWISELIQKGHQKPSKSRALGDAFQSQSVAQQTANAILVALFSSSYTSPSTLSLVWSSFLSHNHCKCYLMTLFSSSYTITPRLQILDWLMFFSPNHTITQQTANTRLVVVLQSQSHNHPAGCK